MTNGIATSDEEIVDMILRHEGDRYTNHPQDRGGPTKYGITIPVLSKYRGRACTAVDIQNLQRGEAATIYQFNYVRPFTGMGHTILRANVIDMSVNAGLSRGIRLLQQTVGVHVDGIFGPRTAAASIGQDWNMLYVGVRLAFYERIVENDPSQLVWRNGWRNRAFHFKSTVSNRRLMYPVTPVGKAYLLSNAA